MFAMHAMLDNCPKHDLTLAKYNTFICVSASISCLSSILRMFDGKTLSYCESQP